MGQRTAGAVARRAEEQRLEELSREIAEGCLANAEEDLAICREWDLIQDDTIALVEAADAAEAARLNVLRQRWSRRRRRRGSERRKRR